MSSRHLAIVIMSSPSHRHSRSSRPDVSGTASPIRHHANITTHVLGVSLISAKKRRSFSHFTTYSTMMMSATADVDQRTVDQRKVRVNTVRFSQNSVGDIIHPNIRTLPWQNKDPHTIPLNVIAVPETESYLSYDNRRLYAAVIRDKDDRDGDIDVILHGPDDEFPAKQNTNIAWIVDGDLYVLHLAALTWWGAITMRCFQQSIVFPLDGTSDEPAFQRCRPRGPEEVKIQTPARLQPIRLDIDRWKEEIRKTSSVYVEKQYGTDVFHPRPDIIEVLCDDQHFAAQAFECKKGSRFILRAAADVYDDNFYYDDGELDVLMAEIDDEVEFAWIEQQLAGTWRRLFGSVCILQV